MYYNNYGYYQPQMQPQQQYMDQLSQLRMQQSQPQAPAQTQSSITWVQGEEGAKAYLVAAGNSVLLMDSEAPVFYIKSTDASGMPMPLRIFDFVERGVPAKAEAASPDYARREDVDKLSAMYEDLSRQYAAIVRELGLARGAEAQNG